jgi:hypothetical protein
MSNYNPFEYNNPTDLNHIWDESLDDEQPQLDIHIDDLFAPTTPRCETQPDLPPPPTPSAPIEFNFPNPVPKRDFSYHYNPPLDEDPLGDALDNDEVTDLTELTEEYSRSSLPPPIPSPFPYDFPPPIPSPFPILKRTHEPDPVPIEDPVDIDITDFKVPSSRIPVMESMVVCALNGWGIEIVKSNRKNMDTAEVEFRVFDFNRYYKISRAICSKHRPTEDLGARIKSLKRWFVNFPKKKDRVENSFSLIVKPTMAIKVYKSIEKNSVSMNLVKRRRKL